MNKIIKSKIIESGYSQKELSQILNISEVTLSKWCNGKLGNISIFIELCKLINLDIRDIKNTRK